MSWLGAARASLDGLFVDPWFTSLWTLQEAFLCPHAFLLPLEAALIRVNCKSRLGTFHPTLEALCTISTALYEIVELERQSVHQKWQADKTNPELNIQVKFLSEVHYMLIHRGLTALATRSPIALYSISQYRRTINDTDRVYGIQQVFGFRLGLTAKGYSTSNKKQFNRFVLEDQLGAALLENNPVASQVHVFTEDVEEGRGWRINATSTVPKLDIKSSIWHLEFQSRCQLSTEKIGGQARGVFEGQVCDFTTLSRAWKTLHEYPPITQILRTKSPQQMILDAVQTEKMVEGEPEDPIWSRSWAQHSVLNRGEQQHRLASALERVVNGSSIGAPLIVLLLGGFVDGNQVDKMVEEQDKYHVGLVLTRTKVEEITYWKRLGICIWQYEYNGFIPKVGESLDLDLVRCGDRLTGWNHQSGLFG